MTDTRTTTEMLDCLAPECDGLTAHAVTLTVPGDRLTMSACHGCGKAENFEEN